MDKPTMASAVNEPDPSAHFADQDAIPVAIPPAASQPRTILNRRRHLSAQQRARSARFLDYWDLMKPEISFLVTISALAGFALGSPDSIDPGILVFSLSGIVMSAAGSGTLNHVLERRLDGQMKRTAGRPLPAGRVSPVSAVVLGISLSLAGIAVLFLAVNALTGWLAIATVVTYLAIYTPLKRRTKYNTLVGCIPGALPALGGWTAATGSVGAGGLALFGILFVWQMPHFLSLAWMYRKDYERARFAMLPVVEPDGRSTGRQIVFFTLALLVVSLWPFAERLVGVPYLLGALALGSLFMRPAITFLRTHSHRSARSVLLTSILYIPALVIVIFVDRFV